MTVQFLIVSFLCINNTFSQLPHLLYISVITNCLPIDVTENMFISTRNFSYGSTVSFRCNPGYRLEGTSSMTCQNNGSWTATVPRCVSVIVHCDDLQLDSHMTKNSTGTTVGTTVVLSCAKGYWLKDKKKTTTATLTCLSTGQWSSSTPFCVPITCQDFVLSAHLQTSTNNVTSGTTVVFQCDDGYILQGQKALVCGDSGNWNGSEPSCASNSPHQAINNSGTSN